MDDIRKIASYILCKYKAMYGKDMDEMKLHKLLYFSQRESFVITGHALFSDTFKAWRYGPVMVSIRSCYKDGSLENGKYGTDVSPDTEKVLQATFNLYADKDARSLSAITHGEYSWRTAHEGYAPMASCDIDVKTEDIAKDAERIKTRRYLLSKYKQFVEST